MPSKQKQRRFLPLQIKSFDTDGAGTFTGYPAVFNNVDQGGDKILPGAFSKTLGDLREKQKRSGSAYLLPIFFGHDPSDPIGGFTDAKEDEYGLFVTGELDLDIEQGRRAYSGMKRGYLNGLSIGYYTIKHSYEGSVRLLRELALIEGSVTPIPMNQDALVVGVKNLGASGFHLTEKGAAYMRRFARNGRRTMAPLPTKGLDFATTFASLQQDDSLQEEWSDTVQALVSSLSNCMWQARWVASGFATSGDDTDYAATASTIIDQFAAQMRDLLGRSFAAGFAPDLDMDGDSFMDPDASEGSEDYMSAPRPTGKAGRVLSAANRDRMSRALAAILDGYSDLLAMHSETEPGPADDPTTADEQPEDGGKSATQDPDGDQERKEGQEPGAEPGAKSDTTLGDTTPSGETEDARQQKIRDQIAALQSQLEKGVA